MNGNHFRTGCTYGRTDLRTFSGGDFMCSIENCGGIKRLGDLKPALGGGVTGVRSLTNDNSVNEVSIKPRFRFLSLPN